MATKVSVTCKGSDPHIIDYEISAGADGKLGTGTHDFSVGSNRSMVQYLTVKRFAAGSITIKAVTGDIEVEVDSPKGKKVKKGSSLSLS